jgi:hypothetical protein
MCCLRGSRDPDLFRRVDVKRPGDLGHCALDYKPVLAFGRGEAGDHYPRSFVAFDLLDFIADFHVSLLIC